MTLIVVGLLDPIFAFKSSLVYQFSGQCVPEGHHIESIDCSKQILMLLPH